MSLVDSTAEGRRSAQRRSRASLASLTDGAAEGRHSAQRRSRASLASLTDGAAEGRRGACRQSGVSLASLESPPPFLQERISQLAHKAPQQLKSLQIPATGELNAVTPANHEEQRPQLAWLYRKVNAWPFEDPEALRSISIMLVLRYLQSEEAVYEAFAKEGFTRSKPTDHFRQFISYDRSMCRKQLHHGLAMHFNRWPAALVCSILAAICCALQLAGMLPVIEISSFGKGTHTGCGGLILATPTFLVTLFAWHKLAPRGFGADVFFDQMCLNQEPALRRWGVNHLGPILFYSWRLVVLHSEDYLNDLWAVYELATFMLLHPGASAELKPLYAPHMLACGVLSWFAADLGWILLHCRYVQGLLTMESVLLVDAALYFVVFLPGSVFLSAKVGEWIQAQRAMPEKLRNFSVNAARCSDEKDRQFLHDNVVFFMRYFHYVGEKAAGHEAIEVFENFVRHELPRCLQRSRGRVFVTYDSMVILGAPHLLLTLDRLSALVLDQIPWKAIAGEFVTDASVALALFPLWGYTANFLIRAAWDKQGVDGRWRRLVIGAAGFTSTLLVLGLYGLMRQLCNHASNHDSDLSFGILVCLALSCLFMVYVLSSPAGFLAFRRRKACVPAETDPKDVNGCAVEEWRLGVIVNC